MCELFALSSRMPATVELSLELFAQHGGGSDVHRDGWGIAYCDGHDALVIREPGPAATSPRVRFLESHGPPSRLVISHIRKATRGAVALENTQPFRRELGGRVHVFAHNGDLPGVEREELGFFEPVGQTDSEHAFCRLLADLDPAWRSAAPGLPSLEERTTIFESFARRMRALGPANFLYTDGDALFVHAHERINRETGRIEPPGLHVLERSCFEPRPVQASGLKVDPHGLQRVTLLASVPLTLETWRPLGPGEVLVVRDGEVQAIGSSRNGTSGR